MSAQIGALALVVLDLVVLLGLSRVLPAQVVESQEPAAPAEAS